MKIRLVVSVRQAEPKRPVGSRIFGEGAFTFTEMMVSLSILVVVSAGIISSHYFGLRMYEITRTRLGASDATRKTFNLLSEEIRAARTVKIGQGTLVSFTEPRVNTAQQGNSIQIYPSASTSVFVRYFRDPTDRRVKRGIGNPTNVSVLAQSVRNPVIFTCEDLAGHVLTNRQGSYALGIRFQFDALPDTGVPVGPGNYYDSYQWQTKITRRAGE